MFRSLCARAARVVLPCFAILLSITTAYAGNVVLVEESWELHVATTDSNSTAPQIATAISPSGSVDAVHAVFELNHQSVPDWAPGGMHLQLWEGEIPMETRKHPKGEVMSSGQEVVTWKKTMRLDDGVLVFEVVDGQSDTWNHFGGQGYLRTGVETSLANLNGYNPDVSVANSGVTYAGNRVTKLVLKQVRRVCANGQQHVDTSVRVAHEN